MSERSPIVRRATRWRDTQNLCALLRWALLLPLALWTASCGNGDPTAPPASSAEAADAGSDSAASRLPKLLEAELTRDATAVMPSDLTSRDVNVRRAATRALARMRDANQREKLLHRLRDEDSEVVTWAAYGLGDVCAGAREKTVQVLATAAASLEAESAPASGLLSPRRAIARAIGRCGTDDAEQLLASWAGRHDEVSIDAIYALGDIARKNKRLREETYVVLLQLTEGDATHEAMPAAFYPIGKAEHLRTPSVLERTRKLAEAALESKGPDRIHAIRALGRCDEKVVPALAKALASADFEERERVEAVRSLARFGRDGQNALVSASGALADAPDPGTWSGMRVHLIVTVLAELTVFKNARPALAKLAGVEPPGDASAAVRRRLSWVRCAAAKHLAERDYKLPALRGCDLMVAADADRKADPFPTTIGARSIVSAIGVDATKITGARLAAWRAYALGGELRARQAAIELIAEHDEIAEAPHVITEALKADAPGVVATAAEIVAKYPTRVAADGGAHPTVSDALLARLDGTGPSEDIETLAQVIRAVAKLKLDKGKALLIQHCGSMHAEIRKHARAALAAIMGKESPPCTAGKPLPLPGELERIPSQSTTIRLESDAGALELVLNPTLAPIAVTRAIDLAKNGFFDGMVVHRVVPGFVSQFGSPTADGYGGVKGLPPLPCETSPVHYGPGTVGVALAGRDTGSSQLFVTHASTPHLDGEYAWLGTGTGDWDGLVDGDVIHKATVSD